MARCGAREKASQLFREAAAAVGLVGLVGLAGGLAVGLDDVGDGINDDDEEEDGIPLRSTIVVRASSISTSVGPAQ